jgi:protein-tyrosine phosphatase
MKTILFVCTGNTCRSPMAAALMNKLLAENKITDIIAGSAGIAASEGESASINAIAAAREFGVDLSKHSARQVTREMIEGSDAVYTMSPPHSQGLKATFPEYAGKISTLGSGIPDPFGGDLNIYKVCRDSILAALTILIDKLEN